MRSILLAVLAALPVINAAVSSPRISKSGRCGSNFGLTCTGSSFGDCCSQYNYCGKTSAHCKSGCQPGFGTCSSPSRSNEATAKVSKDGSCGGKNGFTCLKSVFGNCCSQYGYCGSSNAYCGSGCNPAFGSCSNSAASPPTSKTRSITKPTHTTSTAGPSATKTAKKKISTNSRCGNAYKASPLGMTCAGSKWGNCCSKYSYCGSTDAYCGKGCQPGFGNCKPVSSVPSSTPAKAPVAPSTIALSSSTSSETTSASLTESTYSSSPITIVSAESPSSSTVATSASASASEVESSSSLEATTESTAAPPIVSAPVELLTMSTSELATSEISTSTEAVISSSSEPASSSESPTIPAEIPNTAEAPLPTTEAAPVETETVSSNASVTVSETSVEPTTTPEPSSTEVQILPTETETEAISSTADAMTSASPSSESESSSEPEPTPTPEPASSSVIETTVPLSETPTEVPVSSVVASSTASAPTACNTLAASYNPSFESGFIAPWTLTNANAAWGKTEVLSGASAPFAPLDGSSALYMTTLNRVVPYWMYTLQNVYIPAGSDFNCTVGVKLKINDNRNLIGTMQAVLYVDNKPVNFGQNNIFSSYQGTALENWRRIGGAAVASAQDMHTLMVYVVFPTNQAYNTGFTVGIDDLQCFPTGQCAI